GGKPHHVGEEAGAEMTEPLPFTSIRWSPTAIADLLQRADQTINEPYVRVVAVRRAMKEVSLASWQLKVALKELNKKVKLARNRMAKKFNNDKFFDEPDPGNGGDDDGAP